jgi:hypothetical protein
LGGRGLTLSRTPRLVGVGSWVTTTKSAAVVAARAATVAARVNFMVALFFLLVEIEEERFVRLKVYLVVKQKTWRSKGEMY